MDSSKDPLVTCIIPTIGRDTLAKSVASAINQFEPISVITIFAAKSFTNDISKIENPRNRIIFSKKQSVSELRNEALNYVETKYVCFLDDDDQLTPGFITSMLQISSKYPNKLVASSAIVLRESRILLRPSIPMVSHDIASTIRKYYGFNLFSNNSYLPISSFLFKMDEMNKFDEEMVNREDLKMIFLNATNGIHQEPYPMIKIASNRKRSWQREKVRDGISWMKFLIKHDMRAALKFFLFELSKNLLCKYFTKFFGDNHVAP